MEKYKLLEEYTKLSDWLYDQDFLQIGSKVKELNKHLEKALSQKYIPEEH